MTNFNTAVGVAGSDIRACVVYSPLKLCFTLEPVGALLRRPMQYDADQQSFQSLSRDESFALREVSGFANTETSASEPLSSTMGAIHVLPPRCDMTE